MPQECKLHPSVSDQALEDRGPCDIVVHVLDIEDFLSDRIEHVRESFEEHNRKFPYDRLTSFRWGVVPTEKGDFLLCDEGVMQPPGSEYRIQFFGEGDRSFSMMPVGTFTVDDFEDFRVLGKVPLSLFIRSFGHRLETNFRLCRDAIEKAGPVDA